MSRSRESFERLIAAYERIAKELNYRPNQGDGFGNCTLTSEQIADRNVLRREAADHADHFIKEEDSRHFHIGCAESRTLVAFYYTILAAQTMCSGRTVARELGIPLLEWAMAELRRPA